LWLPLSLSVEFLGHRLKHKKFLSRNSSKKEAAIWGCKREERPLLRDRKQFAVWAERPEKLGSGSEEGGGKTEGGCTPRCVIASRK